MDAHAEAFHQIANHAFFDRNFSNSGLHYFNMQVDFYFQLLRRFHPKLLSMSLRGAVRNFIKLTNLDTYESLCRIYDFVAAVNPDDQAAIRDFARYMRQRVDERSDELRAQGENILEWISALYENRDGTGKAPSMPKADANFHLFNTQPELYFGLNALTQPDALRGLSDMDLFGLANVPIPYDVFKRQMTS